MQLTTLTLNISLHPSDLSAFRASIIEVVGREHHLFHNHDNSEGKDHHHWGYPLIQYSVRHGQATITGINEGSTAIKRLLIPQLSDHLEIKGQSFPIMDFNLKARAIEVNWQSEPRTYGLAGWLALNKENYRMWKISEDEEIRKMVLSQALTGQLRALAEGLQLDHPKQAVGRVLRIDNQKKIQWHEVSLIRFDVLMQCNLHIPTGLNLGRIAAFGFGEIMHPSQYQAYQNSRKRVLSYS